MYACFLTTVATVSTVYQLFWLSTAITLWRTTAETAQRNSVATFLLQTHQEPYTVYLNLVTDFAFTYQSMTLNWCSSATLGLTNYNNNWQAYSYGKAKILN